MGSQNEVTRYGPAWHKEVSGLHVLKVQGTHYEMGRQHGHLLRKWIPRGPIPYYRRYIEKVLRHGGLGALAPLGGAAISLGVGRQVARALPDFALDTIRGMADGSGIPYARMLEGAVMPDSLMWLATALMRTRRVGPAVAHRLALGLGCTSAVAWGPATADGMLLHGRNMDYHGVEVWPGTAAVIFHQPRHGLRYAAVAAAGVPLGGVTAMNEAGLTLAVHQHMFTDQTTIGGTPIGVLGDLVMSQAEDLQQAEQILTRYHPIGSWTYLVADGRRRQVLCFEENHRHHAALRPDPGSGTFGYANIFLDATLGATERDLYGSYWRANLGRHQLSNQLLQQRPCPLDPDAMAGIMGHTGDAECRLRRPLSMLLTVSTVVMRPEDGALWVATGGTPVCNNVFEPFHLGRQDHAPELGQLNGGEPGDAVAAGAFGRYRDAFLAYFERDDPRGALPLMRQAAAQQPDQPLYHVLVGLLALKTGDAPGAAVALDRALELGHPDPERLGAFELWRGRAADLCARRELALEHYRRALASPADAPVHTAARRGQRLPFSRRRARHINIEFAYGDVMHP